MNRILTVTAAGLAGLMMLTGPALADRDDDRWRGHDGNGRYERGDRDHDRDRRGHADRRDNDRKHGRHDNDRRGNDRHDNDRYDRDHRHGGWAWNKPGRGNAHGKHKYRYKHDQRYWNQYDRWYHSHGRRHVRPGWSTRDHRLLVIYERWLDDHHHHRDRNVSGGIYLNFPIRIGH